MRIRIREKRVSIPKYLADRYGIEDIKHLLRLENSDNITSKTAINVILEGIEKRRIKRKP